MIIDRRTFILISAPLVATAAAFTILPAGMAGASSSELAGGDQNRRNITLKIHGWDRRDPGASNGSKPSPAGLVTADPNCDEVFISINQSWRAAWR
jgi:hypothetical protein